VNQLGMHQLGMYQQGVNQLGIYIGSGGAIWL